MPTIFRKHATGMAIPGKFRADKQIFLKFIRFFGACPKEIQWPRPGRAFLRQGTGLSSNTHVHRHDRMQGYPELHLQAGPFTHCKMVINNMTNNLFTCKQALGGGVCIAGVASQLLREAGGECACAGRQGRAPMRALADARSHAAWSRRLCTTKPHQS